MKETKIKKYKIFYINAGVFSEDVIVEAKSAREALQSYLDVNKSNIKFKRSGVIDVEFKVTPFREENGKKYFDGRCIWFKITN